MFSKSFRCFVGIAFISSLFGSQILGQENQEIHILQDSSQIIQLKEVIVFANPYLQHLKQNKPLSSIDDYLEGSHHMNMIKRGAYAWEPNMNGMSSERLSVTIDGMQIFGACTDKMDPITSYVDVSNLSEAHISHGQSGNEFGNTIGGGLDLKLKKSQFVPKGWSAMLEAGFETNNSLKVAGASVSLAESKYYINTDFTYRDADNYKNGNDNEVLYSQYTKMNASVNAGYNLNKNGSLHTTFIYDKATDVGYPALTMDVSLAEAYIASLSYQHKALGDFRNWETKFYLNNITHVMDDTTRPDVPIHMDMPGWSKTYGAYSKIEKSVGKHNLRLNLNGYFNNSIAEMTMYPTDPNENSMFMYTWPDVNTTNFALYLADNFNWKNWDIEMNLRLASHNNHVRDEFGLNSLQIFYPEMKAEKSRFLKSVGMNFHRPMGHLHLNVGLGYGERAPSVSEGYGFYLFNSFDNYDYVGNPHLPNESSLEARINLEYHLPNMKIGAGADTFYIQDYIIGKINPDFAPMSIGASGIKVYENLSSAQISNFKIYSSYQISTTLTWNANVQYHIGQDNNSNPLPLISPLSYNTNLSFYNKKWSADVQWNGAAKQKDFSAAYGEDETAAYNIISAFIGKSFNFGAQKLMLKSGFQNLFNENYSTYTDWRNIPRMGRNFFLHASFTFN